MVRAEFGGVGQARFVVVDGDNGGWAERPKYLNREGTQAACADDHGSGAGRELVQHLAHAVIRRCASVGKWGCHAWIERADGNHIARGAGLYVLGEAAVASVAAAGKPVSAGAVVAAQAERAHATRAW